MLKLIGGTLVGGVKYSDIYINFDEDEDTSSTNDYVNNNATADVAEWLDQRLK